MRKQDGSSMDKVRKWHVSGVECVCKPNEKHVVKACGKYSKACGVLMVDMRNGSEESSCWDMMMSCVV